MPQIPGIAGPASFGRRADAGDFGAAEAQAGAQRGAVVGQIGQAAATAAVIGDRIREAADQAKLSRKAAEYAAGLDEAIVGLQDDPDLDTHQERIQKASEELLRGAQKDLPPNLHGQLEDRVFSAGARAKLEVRRNVQVKRVAQGRADTAQTVDVLANVAGRTLDPRDREAVRVQALTALDAARAGNLIDQAGHDAGVSAFDQKTTEALARAGKNDHPQATLEQLRARTGGFERMEEPARQQWIEMLTNEVQQRERIAKAEKAEAEARVEKAQRDMQQEAEEHGYFAAADGLMTTDWVKENRDRLSPGAVRYFLGVAEKAEAAGASDPREIFRLESLRYTNPKAFVGEKIDPARVGPRKAVELLKAQAEAKKADFVPTGRSFASRLTSRLGEMRGLDDDEKAELFRIGESDLQHFSNQKGGRPTADEEQSIIDDVLLRRVVRKPGFLGFGRDTAVLPPGAPLEVPNVPGQYVDQIVDSLKRAGKPINPQAISERYEKAKALGLVK